MKVFQHSLRSPSCFSILAVPSLGFFLTISPAIITEATANYAAHYSMGRVVNLFLWALVLIFIINYSSMSAAAVDNSSSSTHVY